MMRHVEYPARELIRSEREQFRWWEAATATPACRCAQRGDGGER
jgi:hypothetical protein